MLYYYKVPKIARRKQERAEWAAFLVHCMSMLADRGLLMLGLTLDQTKWIKGGLKEDQMRQLLLLFPDSEEGTSENVEGSDDEPINDTPAQVYELLLFENVCFWQWNVALPHDMKCRCWRS